MLEKLKRKKSKKRIIAFIILILCFVLAVSVVYAADASWYRKNSAILSQNDIAISVLRKIGWFILSLLVRLCTACEGLYNSAFSFINLTNYPKINTFIESFKPVVIALMALALLYLGYTLMVEHEKKPKLMINICIVILCVTSSGLVFGSLNNWLTEFKSAIDNVNLGVQSSNNSAMEVVRTHIVDLVYLNYKYDGLENVDYSAEQEKYRGTYLAEYPKDFDAVNISEVLNPISRYDWKGKTKDLLEHYVYRSPKGDGSNYEDKTADVENGFGWNSKDDADIGNTFYYRYTFSFMTAYMQLGALILIYITMAYKVVRVSFELIIARLFAYLYSAELSGGEKIKKIFVFIRDSYILLIVCSICIKVYLIAGAWMDSMGWDLLVKAIFSLFLAFIVIDGPNLVEKLLGMDAGLKSSTARILAIGRAASGIGRAAGGAAKAASPKNIANKVNNLKSGEVSKGGLAAGAYGKVMGKSMTDGDAKTASTSERVGGLSGISKGEKQKRAQERENNGGWGGSNGFNASTGGASTHTSGGQGSSKGEKGDAGAKGDKGEKGDAGAKGDKGEKGDAGHHGLEGKEGKVGEQGKDGSQRAAFMNKADSSKTSSQANPFESNSGKTGNGSRDFMNQNSKGK